MLHHVTVTLEHHNKWSEQKPSFKARKRMMCTKARMANPAKKKKGPLISDVTGRNQGGFSNASKLKPTNFSADFANVRGLHYIHQ